MIDYTEFLIVPPLLMASVEDIKTKEVRNIYAVIILLIKVILIIIKEDSIVFLVDSVVGALISAFIILFSFLLKRGGIGKADIYILISLGFYMGIKLFLRALLCVSIVSLTYSIFLLATKKAKIDTKLPFLPFILIGTVISICMEAIW